MSFYLDPLDVQLILSKIHTKYIQKISKLDIFDKINSTNTYLLNSSKEKSQSGWICIANEQTIGRGQYGKEWNSPPNTGIYFSLLWKFNQTKDLFGLSGVIGIILSYVLKKYLNGAEIKIKWPNDILFGEKKLAGILLENSSNNVIIGIGMNLIFSEKEHKMLPHAISLFDITHKKPNRNEIIGEIINELFLYLPIFDKKGLSAFNTDLYFQITRSNSSNKD